MGSVSGEEDDRAEADYVRAKTSVWWDIENCHVPKKSTLTSDPHSIARNISSALAKLNYCGPVSISAYGDTAHIPQDVQQALNSTGIALNHVPAGVKDASDKKILVDMMLWAVDNPAPANYLLISGDRDFSNALHQLRMRRYNILLARPRNASAPLVAAAKSIWLWTSLLAGGPPLASSDLLQLKKDSVISSAETSQQSLPDSSPANLEKASSSLPKSSPMMGTGSASSKIKGKNNKIESSNCGNPCTAEPSPAESSLHDNLKMTVPFERLDVYGYMDTSFGNHMNQSTYPHMLRQNNLNMRFGFTQETCNPSSSYTHPPPATPFVQPSYDNFSCCPPEYGPPMVSGSLGEIHNPPTCQQSNTQLRQPVPTDFASPPLVREPGGGGFFGNATRYFDDRSTPKTCNESDPRKPYGSEVSPASSVASAAWTPDDGVSETSGSSSLSEKARHQLDAVLTALGTLKCEKITPTEANITDCIKYGEPKYQSVDAKHALHEAIKLEAVVKENLGAVEVYIGKNEWMWDCVDPFGNDTKLYPEATWTEIKSFLRSSWGKKKILASKCRYEAATFMKKKCLQQHSLGDVLLLLHLMITVKKWVLPHPSGWKPVKILLPDYIDTKRSGSEVNVAEAPTDGVSKSSGSSSRSEKTRHQLDAILTALRTLKCEKVTPTEANITDCIKYGEPKYQSVDAKHALHEAIKLEAVVKENLGAVEVYIGKNEWMWDCVDPFGSDPKLYPKETWTEIKSFLRSSSGKKKILASNCRYEAAIFMKRECLPHHSLGDVLLLLNLMITVKKWLMPHPSEWKPVKILLR